MLAQSRQGAKENNYSSLEYISENNFTLLFAEFHIGNNPRSFSRKDAKAQKKKYSQHKYMHGTSFTAVSRQTPACSPGKNYLDCPTRPHY
jgi:hypothetical protein